MIRILCLLSLACFCCASGLSSSTVDDKPSMLRGLSEVGTSKITNPSSEFISTLIGPSESEKMDETLSEEFPSQLTFLITVRTLFESKNGAQGRLVLHSLRDLGSSTFSVLNLASYGIDETKFFNDIVFTNQKTVNSVLVSAGPPRYIRYTIDAYYYVTVPDSSALFASYNSFVRSFKTFSFANISSSCEVAGCWPAATNNYILNYFNQFPLDDQVLGVNGILFSNASVIVLSPSPTSEPTVLPTLYPTAIPTSAPTSVPTNAPTGGAASSSSSGVSTTIIIIAVVAGSVPIIAVIALICFRRVVPKKRGVIVRDNFASTARPVVARGLDVVDLDAAPVDLTPEAVVILPEGVPLAAFASSESEMTPISRAPSVRTGIDSSLSSPRLTSQNSYSTPIRGTSMRLDAVASVPINTHDEEWEPVPPEAMASQESKAVEEEEPKPSAPVADDPLAAMLALLPPQISLKALGIEFEGW